MQDVGFWVGSPGAAVDQAESKREMSEYPLRRGLGGTSQVTGGVTPENPEITLGNPVIPWGGQNAILEHLKSTTFANTGMRGHTGDRGSQGTRKVWSSLGVLPCHNRTKSPTLQGHTDNPRPTETAKTLKRERNPARPGAGGSLCPKWQGEKVGRGQDQGKSQVQVLTRIHCILRG